MPVNDTIFKRLEAATEVELKEICSALKINCTKDFDVISKDYRSAAGHTVVNIFRSNHDLLYKRILIDVADKLKLGFGWTDFSMDDDFSEVDIEEKILEYINDKVQEELKKLSDKDREEAAKKIKDKLESLGYSQSVVSSMTSVIASGTLAAAVATPLTLSIFYSGVMASIWAGVFGPSAVLLAMSGTGIGLVIALPLLVGTLGGPAYRKIIPATIQMIIIRKRIEAEELL